jgi:hypothetical protein
MAIILTYILEPHGKLKPDVYKVAILTEHFVAETIYESEPLQSDKTVVKVVLSNYLIDI